MSEPIENKEPVEVVEIPAEAVEISAEAVEISAEAVAEAVTEPSLPLGEGEPALPMAEPNDESATSKSLPLGEGGPALPVDEGQEEPAPLSNAEVMAHTASLWKFKPLPQDEPENSPQYGTDYQVYDGGRIFAARVRGKKHKHEGTNCDDWMEIAHYGDIAMLVVSDGAGSKHYSRIGSRESCQAAIAYLKRGVTELEAQTDSLKWQLSKSFDDPDFSAVCAKLVALVQEAVLAGRRAVVEAWEKHGTDEKYTKPLGRELVLQDFAATLLVTLSIPVPRLKEQLLVTCQVGDGMIAALDSRGSYGEALRLLADADSGEYSGETDFLTSSKMENLDELRRRTKVSRCRADLIMAMTDGVSDDYDPQKPELYALYLDLLANKVLLEEEVALQQLTAEELAMLKAAPAPIAYPWVNNPQQQVALQYTEKLLESSGLTLEELWQCPDLARFASLGVSIEAKQRPDRKLQTWLDNYTRRGSFDDRTLAIVQLERKA